MRETSALLALIHRYNQHLVMFLLHRKSGHHMPLATTQTNSNPTVRRTICVKAKPPSTTDPNSTVHNMRESKTTFYHHAGFNGSDTWRRHVYIYKSTYRHLHGSTVLLGYTVIMLYMFHTVFKLSKYYITWYPVHHWYVYLPENPLCCSALRCVSIPCIIAQ